jgi:hypothetical protein
MKIWMAGLCCLVFLAACRKEVTTQILTGPNGTLDKQAVGRSAHDLLSADQYTSLSLNIQYAPGMKPQDQSINNLVNFLNTYLHKPAGITYTTTASASLGKDPATLTDIAYLFIFFWQMPVMNNPMSSVYHSEILQSLFLKKPFNPDQAV